MSTPDDQLARRRRTNKRILIGFGAAVGVLVLVALIGMVAGGDNETAVPRYSSNRERDVITAVVDFDKSADLQAVFDDIVDANKGLADGGYFVYVNCSTGGSAGADNRLANGKFAIGNLGAAQTGLGEGASEFKINDGVQCPK